MTRRAVLFVAAGAVGLLLGVFGFRALAPTLGPGPTANGPQRLSPFQRANVEWLLANRLPCRGCHVIDGRGGRLGPDLTNVGGRMSAEAVEQHLLNPQARNPLSIMPPVRMPQSWRVHVARYLTDATGKQLAPNSAEAVAARPHGPSADGDAPDGASLYRRLCGGCHGDAGRGDGPNAEYFRLPPHATRIQR